MNSKYDFICILGVVLCVILIPLSAFTQVRQYIVVDLDPIERRIGFALAINESGQVVGYYLDENSNFSAKGFLWYGGALQDLGTLGGDSSTPVDINNAGNIVGKSRNEEGFERAFLWQDGDMIDLGTFGGPSSSAYAINDHGAIVGEARDDNNVRIMRAFLWQNGSMQDLSISGRAIDINNIKQIAGSGSFPGNFTRGFFWENDEIHEFGTFGGNMSWAVGINNAGQVVGYALTSSGLNRAFLWENGEMLNLGTLGGFHSYAHSINDHGHIVGLAWTSTHAHRGFFWEDGVMYDVNNFIDQNSGWMINNIYSINNSGYMVGTGFHDDEPGRSSPVLLIPGSTNPEGPQLVSPYSGEEINGQEVELRWQAPANADSFYVQVSMHQAVFDNLSFETITPDTFQIVTGLVPQSEYYWRVHAYQNDVPGDWSEVGHFTVATTTSMEQSDGLPNVFALHQNYPNPFNPSTIIQYDIPSASNVLLEVFNVLGQRVALLADGYHDAGSYNIQFNARHLPSGLYVYRLHTDDRVAVRNMLLLK